LAVELDDKVTRLTVAYGINTNEKVIMQNVKQNTI